MTKFKLYEDILSRSWNRYFYDVEANTIEEAVEKVRYEEVDCYDSEQIYEVIDELDPVDNNGSPTKFKRGSCCIKKYHQTMNQTLRSYWFIDNEIPIFKGEDREYIEKLIA